jgi:hypothetical protein
MAACGETPCLPRDFQAPMAVVSTRMVNDKFPKAVPYGFEIVDAAIERCESESIENLRIGQIGRFFCKFAAN